jgi:multidrug efflux system outer membrane protein
MRTLILIVFTIAVAGCAVGPNYFAPEPAVPDVWHEELSRGLATGDANLQTWWTHLDDPKLTSLIRRARDGNLNLRETLARVEEARARRGIAKGEWFPDIAGEGSIQRARSSEDTVRVVPPGQDRNQAFYSSGFDASWEIDFFGRVRRSVESADAGLQASVENYRDALVVLFADVALTYVDVRTFQERLRYALGNVGTQSQTLKLTEDRNKAGLVGDLDVRQAELNLSTTEATVPQLRQGVVQSINRLGVLLGESPSALHAELRVPEPIPTPPKEVLVELPTELLRQRPDVRAAERQLASETADIGVATADLYPRFSLLGTFAFDAISVSDWIKGSSSSYGVGPAMRWSLFDGGRIRSNIEAEDAQSDQATAFYEQTVLNALEDVESSIVAYVEENERRDALRRAATAAEQATELVNTLYRTGLTDFQNVQDTERQLFIQQDSLAASEGLVTQNLIRLYRALGGGWAP